MICIYAALQIRLESDQVWFQITLQLRAKVRVKIRVKVRIRIRIRVRVSVWEHLHAQALHFVVLGTLQFAWAPE